MRSKVVSHRLHGSSRLQPSVSSSFARLVTGPRGLLDFARHGAVVSFSLRSTREAASDRLLASLLLPVSVGLRVPAVPTTMASRVQALFNHPAGPKTGAFGATSGGCWTTGLPELDCTSVVFYLLLGHVFVLWAKSKRSWLHNLHWMLTVELEDDFGPLLFLVWHPRVVWCGRSVFLGADDEVGFGRRWRIRDEPAS